MTRGMLGLCIGLILSWLGTYSAQYTSAHGVINHNLLFSYSTPYSWVIWSVSLIILAIVLISTSKSSELRFAAGLVLGAGCYNLIERIKHGGVLDYLPGIFNTYANASDYIISFGIIVIIAIHLVKLGQSLRK